MPPPAPSAFFPAPASPPPLPPLRTWCLLFLLATLTACIPPGEETSYAGVVVDLNDPVSRRLYDFGNERNADSLAAYLAHPNPSYRYLAARALASFPTLPPPARAALESALPDREELVAAAAAYALGQAGEGNVQPLFQAFDTTGLRENVNAAIVAASGKMAPATHLRDLTRVTTYEPTDTLLNVGQLRGLYYFARRGERSASGDSLALRRLLDPAQPPEVRRWAAFYLQRFAVAPTAADRPATAALLEPTVDAAARLAAVRSLAARGTPEDKLLLTATLDAERDWRVRHEIVRALGRFDYSTVRDALVTRLQDPHALVRRTAATQLLQNGTAQDATFYRQLARDSSQTDIRYLLLAAANRHLPLYLSDYRARINFDLERAYNQSADPYERADILPALGEFAWNYRTIYELYRGAEHPATRSAAAETLAKISGREDFDAFFRASARRVRLDLSAYFQEMITSREIGPAYHAASAISARPELFRALYPDRAWLRTALDGFQLPRDVEAYHAVNQARAALDGAAEPALPASDQPAVAIDWNQIETNGNREVVVETDAGKIILQLLPTEAPASVSRFLTSVEAGYYDGKVFHRVVPNFVAQGGGPLGDGFGSEGWSLRTETPGRHYDRPGLVGLASAGKDTEGVQFFFTHRATPHLDGNYTIFALVAEGQEVVDRLTVGSRIDRIRLR